MLVDGISQKLSKKRNSWVYIIVFVIVLTAGFCCFGRLGADFILDNIEPLSLFKNGKYLILLQNNAELRSSGGFIGSFAVAEIQDFEIKNLTFNTNIDALDRSFTDQFFVPAPDPLQDFLKNKSWALRDSNYDASFPEASKDILSFFNKETGETVDGVIALNAKVLVDLLKLTGPIKLDKYEQTIDSNNFYDVTQYQIEKGYFTNPENWVINEPKEFLKDLYPAIISEALNKKIDFVKLIQKDLDQKEIILYFIDPNKQQIAEQHNWAGKIPENQELKNLFGTDSAVDYLYINSNSYSGDKSSIKIKESVDYKVMADENKRVKATVKITKMHTGTYTWPDGPNDTWTRIFVPENSQLISAKINERNILPQDLTTSIEAGKTFFGYQIFTNPGQVNILEFSYLLPFKTLDYHLLVQKQPGALDIDLNVIFDNKVLFDGVLNKDIQL